MPQDHEFPETLQKDLKGLSGISVDTLVTCHEISFRENILFTHHGLSGPAALQASLYWNPGDPITIDLLPGLDIAAWLLSKKKEGSQAEVKNLLAAFLPKNFAERFTEIYFRHLGIPLSQIPDKSLGAFAHQLKNWMRLA